MNMCVHDGYLTVNNLHESKPRGTWPRVEAEKYSPKVEMLLIPSDKQQAVTHWE